MTTVATTFSSHIRRPRATYRINSRSSYMKRFRHFIEHSDWDEKILTHEDLANKICIGLMIVAGLYFVPVFVKLFLR